MSFATACIVACLLIAQPVLARADEATVLFRIFLQDGKNVVSFGEFARLEDEVVFSMPVGGPPEAPRLHVVSIPAATVDWDRTERYTLAVRSGRYAESRGEDDFQMLSSEVARVLNQVVLSTDKRAALKMAEDARRTLADWPAAHYGYRENDVREVVSLLDEAISELQLAVGSSEFTLSLVASQPAPPSEPLLPVPSLKELVDQTFLAATLVSRVTDRIALLQDALVLLKDPGLSLSPDESSRLRRTAESQIRLEGTVDERYRKVTRRLLTAATKAAAQARIADVERVLSRVSTEDARLGGQRPEMIQALNASLRVELANARQLRLLRDQWLVRQGSYRAYQRAVGGQLVQLVRIEPSLEAIRRLEGPSPTELQSLRRRIEGGADRLARLTVPDHLRATHDLLVGAWRFAENAVKVRYDAVTAGDVSVAWQASSSAAAALLMLTRVQQDIQSLLEPPRLP